MKTSRRDRHFARLRREGIEEYDDFVRMISPKSTDYLALMSAIRARPRSVLDLDIAGAVQLATLLADHGRADDSRALFRALIDEIGVDVLRKDGRFTYAELILDDEADLDAMIHQLHIRRDDIAQPWLFAANRDHAGSSSWVTTVSRLFAIDGLEGVRLAAGGEAPFDRIAAAPSNHVDGPLVTVIIPTYAPDERIATAVESLISQSLRSLQILIMDDHSPAKSRRRLDLWRDRDPRIEVVHLQENNGPYLARNLAVSEHARGSYVTVHDDDDWSHPRKLELQVAHLESHPREVANMVNGVRASDELVFGRVNGNPVWTQQALSSLMVRRRLFDEIGYWDIVNRAGDAEFNDRIRSWSGRRIPVVGRVPLMFYRMRGGSLSDGEFRRGYMDPRRRAYFEAYSAWHEREAAMGRTPYIPVDDRDGRPFNAPADLLGRRANTLS